MPVAESWMVPPATTAGMGGESAISASDGGATVICAAAERPEPGSVPVTVCAGPTASACTTPDPSTLRNDCAGALHTAVEVTSTTVRSVLTPLRTSCTEPPASSEALAGATLTDFSAAAVTVICAA